MNVSGLQPWWFLPHRTPCSTPGQPACTSLQSTLTSGKTGVENGVGEPEFSTDDTPPLLILDVTSSSWCGAALKETPLLSFPFELSSIVSPPQDFCLERGPLGTDDSAPISPPSISFPPAMSTREGQVLPPSFAPARTSSSHTLLLGHLPSWLSPKRGNGNLPHSRENSRGVGFLIGWREL